MSYNNRRPYSKKSYNYKNNYYNNKERKPYKKYPYRKSRSRSHSYSPKNLISSYKRLLRYNILLSLRTRPILLPCPLNSSNSAMNL